MMRSAPIDVSRAWWPTVGLVVAIVVFLATRLIFIDADVPSWPLTQYSPIDEFAYAVPAFNLVQYGTWVHQAASWAPLEGLPMNAAQNIVAAGSLLLLGDSYLGLRSSSVVFGLIVFLGLVAIVRHQASTARRLDAVPAALANAVTIGAAVLLLVDFSSILSARIVEPTVTRLAAAVVVLYLVSRGTFLGERGGVGRSLVFGAVVTAAVLFVYIYNLWLAPAAFVTLVWWAYRSGGWGAVVRHGAAFLGGALLVAIAYFALIAVIYGQDPIEWYRIWIGSFSNSARATGLSIDKVLSILDANIFRLDPAFLGLFIASLPIFTWKVIRRPDPFGLLIGVGLVCFVAQSAVVADYPARKFIAMLLFAVPIVASGILGVQIYRDRVMAGRWSMIAALAWLVGALALTVFEARISPVPARTGRLGLAVFASGLIGAAAIAILATMSRPLAIRIGAGLLGLAILAPLLVADATFIYRRPTTTYRDAQRDVAAIVDGQVTAGGWSFGMQLYNSSRPVLSAYQFGLTRSEYEDDVVRLFTEGGASSMFDYVDAKTRTRWESLGFRVADTYQILLPRGQILGRYTFGPTP